MLGSDPPEHPLSSRRRTVKWVKELAEWFVAGIGLTLGYRVTSWLVRTVFEAASG